jgi:effector-binding domain-containing protein
MRCELAATVILLVTSCIQPGAEEPKLVHRDKTPYMAIRTTVTMKGMATVMPENMPKLVHWLDAHNVKPTGPEFIRYLKVDMEKGLEIEIGLPVAKSVAGDRMVKPGVLPAGRYVSLTHFGHYSGLVAPNAQLQEWAKTKGLTWKMNKTKSGEEWAGRVEFYKTDPDKQPDPGKWETEILYLISDSKGT